MKKIIVITILMMLVFTTVVSAAMYQDVDVNQKFYVLEGSDPTSERDFAWSTDFTIKEAKRVADEIFTEDMSVREKVAAVYF